MKKLFIYYDNCSEINASEIRHIQTSGYVIDFTEKEFQIFLKFKKICMEKIQPFLDKENEDRIIMDAQYGSRNDECFIEQVAVKIFKEGNEKISLSEIKNKISSIHDKLYRGTKTLPSKIDLEKNYKLKMFT